MLPSLSDNEEYGLSPAASTPQRAQARAWLAEYNLALAENERRERQVAALYELWRSVPGTETGRLLQRVTERAVGALDAHTCSLLLRDPNGDTLRVAASVGLPQDVAESVTLLVGERIAGRVAASGQPILLNKDPRTHPLLAGEGRDAPPGDISQRPEVESALCTPVVGADGGILGVMCLSRFAPATPFVEGDLRVFSLFAAQAGAVIAQARCREEGERAAEEAAARSREGAHQEHLQALSRMGAAVAHELRNPLSSIKGAAQFLLRDCDGESDDPRNALFRDFLTIVVEEVDGLGRLTTSLQEFARLAPLQLEWIDLREILDYELALMRSELTALGVNDVAVDGKPGLVRVDRVQVGQALRHLVRNAAQAAAEQHSVRDAFLPEVTVGFFPTPEDVTVTVTDNGPGIPEAIHDRVFEPFFTTRTRGTGLGLSLVQRVARAHGGQVCIEPSGIPVASDRGTRLIFCLPRDNETILAK